MKISQLKSFKHSGEKITCLTAYDASFAETFDNCGVDIILVGDSLGNVVQGAQDTLSVSMDDMYYHTKSVVNGSQRALIIADLPSKSYANPQQTLMNASRLIDAGAHMVKFEGGREHEESFKALKDSNIPVCGHLGLLPQSVLEYGGYKVQGKDQQSADRITEDAVMLESWGVEVIVLECIPSQLASVISKKLEIPTIGIGAGVECDGQVLVSYDMLGINQKKQPRFVKNFLNSAVDISSAVDEYIVAVKSKSFPAKEHTY
jgi:3-methyl-2-oxobutanoate hydroxymethyltransferase